MSDPSSKLRRHSWMKTPSFMPVQVWINTRVLFLHLCCNSSSLLAFYADETKCRSALLAYNLKLILQPTAYPQCCHVSSKTSKALKEIAENLKSFWDWSCQVGFHIWNYLASGHEICKTHKFLKIGIGMTAGGYQSGPEAFLKSSWQTHATIYQWKLLKPNSLTFTQDP